MGDLTSYAAADFIPFTAEVYFRLIERVSETWWPLHILTVTAGLVSARLAWTGRVRSAGSLLAAALAWVGATFLIRDYAELNWAGSWFGSAFLVAAVLLLLFVLSQPGGAIRHRGIPVVDLIGLALVTLGVAIYPLIASLAGRGWSQAETFGIHPDPTAIATLGVALLILRGFRLWLVAVTPVAWCLVSALTLQVLQAPWSTWLYVTVGVALLGLIWSSTAGEKTQMRREEDSA